jgi:hypothetical protein
MLLPFEVLSWLALLAAADAKLEGNGEGMIWGEIEVNNNKFNCGQALVVG